MFGYDIFQRSDQSFPDPALEARVFEEHFADLRDNSMSEEEYHYWDSCVSEARVEQQWWERDDPR